MPTEPLTPLKITPIFKNAMWGGSRLRSKFGLAPSPDPVGEAWLLSDQGSNLSVIANGMWSGTTLRHHLERWPERILGKAKLIQGRFPILLKFIHASAPLSVQVHPKDAKARELEGPTAIGKTEAWVVLEADPIARIYAGLQVGVDAAHLRQSLLERNVEELLYLHVPTPGDCYFLPAGSVHAIGAGLVLFEIQQTSDLTYRLHDWGRVDPKTGKPRELHVEKALASIDFTIGPCRPAYPTDEGHGRVRPSKLIECDYFSLSRWDTDKPFRAGATGSCRVLVGVQGKANIRHAGREYSIALGDTWLLPAEVGACECMPLGETTILECGLPD